MTGPGLAPGGETLNKGAGKRHVVTMPSRRRVLAVGWTASATILAGCLGNGDDRDEPDARESGPNGDDSDPGAEGDGRRGGGSEAENGGWEAPNEAAQWVPASIVEDDLFVRVERQEALVSVDDLAYTGDVFADLESVNPGEIELSITMDELLVLTGEFDAEAVLQEVEEGVGGDSDGDAERVEEYNGFDIFVLPVDDGQDGGVAVRDGVFIFALSPAAATTVIDVAGGDGETALADGSFGQLS